MCEHICIICDKKFISNKNAEPICSQKCADEMFKQWGFKVVY
jgi:endogenous inhibitor of DNA gyrase (YacG/DUF329 family)